LLKLLQQNSIKRLQLGEFAFPVGMGDEGIVWNWSLCICGSYQPRVLLSLTQGYIMSPQAPPCCHWRYAYPYDETAGDDSAPDKDEETAGDYVAPDKDEETAGNYVATDKDEETAGDYVAPHKDEKAGDKGSGSSSSSIPGKCYEIAEDKADRKSTARARTSPTTNLCVLTRVTSSVLIQIDSNHVEINSFQFFPYHRITGNLKYQCTFLCFGT
jgi:hypothetical protein